MAMIWRSFVRGRIGVPAAGMERLIEEFARPLPPGCVQLSTPVSAVQGQRVQTAVGPVHARAVIVATDPAAAAGLLPGFPVAPQRVLVTTYHAAAVPPVPARSCCLTAPAAPESPAASC